MSSNFSCSSLSNQKDSMDLELSLKDINTILADLDDEIAIERELLSQIDETDKTTGSHKYSPRYDEHNMTWQSKDIVTLASEKNKNIVPDMPILQDEWALEDPFEQVPQSVRPVTVTKLTTTVTQESEVNINIRNHPFRRSIVNYMHEERVKYACAFVKGVFEAMSRKTDEDVKVILEAFATTLIRMVDNNELICNGKVLQGRFRDVAKMTQNLEPILFIKICKAFLIALKHRLVTYPDGLDLMKTYDHLFNAEEGNQLLDVIVAVNNYNVKDYGKSLAIKLAEKCIRVFVAPVVRQCGSPQVQFYIKKVNDVYEKRFLSGRSMPNNIVYSLMESDLTLDTPNRRSMSKTYRHLKLEYKKMIRHYILKHPTIFKIFAKHYKQSKERKRRLLKHKNHRNSHNKKHHHSHKQRYQKHLKNNPKEQALNETSHTTQNITLFRGIPNKYQSSKVQKRFTIIEKLPRHFQKVSTGVFFRRSEIQNPSDIKQNISHGLSREFPSTKMFSNNNTILEKIIGDSSYSDDEIYLKTMLKDAYFHGNHS